MVLFIGWLRRDFMPDTEGILPERFHQPANPARALTGPLCDALEPKA